MQLGLRWGSQVGVDIVSGLGLKNLGWVGCWHEAIVAEASYVQSIHNYPVIV